MGEWVRVKLGQLGRVVTGATPKSDTPDSWGDHIDFITPSDQVRGSREARAGRRLSLVGAQRLAGRVIPPGSTCFTCIGSTIGKVSRVDKPAVTNQQINSLVPHPGVVDQDFIYYLLVARAPLIALSASGSATPIINKSYFEECEVLVPDLKIQQAIGSVLAALDDKIANNEEAVQVIQALVRSIYEQSLSLGATTTTVGTIAEIFDGPHATPIKTDSGPWFLSISSLKEGRLVLAESAHLSEVDFAKWTRRATPRGGDVLFSYETRLGEAALMPSGVRGCLGRRMAMLRPLPDMVGPSVLNQAFRSRSFQEQIRRRAVRGATVDRIPLNELAVWPITLPACETERLESQLSGLDELTANCERQSLSLAELRDTLLPKLMSGQLRIKNAEKIVEDST
jgi:type I restriction enzyme, S subunit